ncbi:hypothetical protein JANAI62_16940 [Jannaschia pagri]|uniref:Phosphoribosylamine--glycine ligase n=1 Tax=Jannaschia pagri TaxID=2829797 RepID=A0ABQ4NL64_9RHOB|nr:hypothetical protein JANAI61_16970 [Jannaschia sp. AI_61]GIT95071.1 hypothetical protein JANAI62_16940 [Jannaschia sp. AI_62]
MPYVYGCRVDPLVEGTGTPSVLSSGMSIVGRMSTNVGRLSAGALVAIRAATAQAATLLNAEFLDIYALRNRFHRTRILSGQKVHRT